MEYLEFLIQGPVQYTMTGKFKAPDSNWVHMRRYLLDCELIFVTEGVLYITVSGIKYTVQKGDFLVCPPSCYQAGTKQSSSRCYGLQLVAEGMRSTNGGDIDKNNVEEHQIKVPLQGQIHNFEKIIVMLKQLQDGIRSYRDDKLNNYLTTAILCEFHNQCQKNLEIAQKKDRHEQIYNDILDYIKWYRNTNLKVIDIANHFGYNEKYLSHLFHSIKGMSLKQYILQEKMDLAKYILVDTNDTIASIAQQLGFSDSHNFMKAFKKQVGFTPTEYRNTHAKRLLYYV